MLVRRLFSFKIINSFTLHCRSYNLNTHVVQLQNQEFGHVPVMCQEVLHYLNPQKKSFIIDMTFGSGGHTKIILEKVPDVKILCLDRDTSAFEKAKVLSEKYPEQVIACHGKFSDLPNILINHDISPNSIDGILFDFGCSSMQLDDPERGFSLSKSGPLDMRMDRGPNDDTPTAADVIAHAEEEDLIKIFKIYGQEKRARKIARAIVEARYIFPPIKTTSELKELIASACSNEFRRDKLQRPSHVATKVFQALRIFVNDELNEINFGILQAHKLLKLGGRLVTLCFHSLEDTIVKRHLTGNIINNSINLSPLKYASYNLVHDLETMKQMQTMKWTPLTKHVVIPTEEEITLNPRSRSAKLRAALKNVD